MAVSIAVCAALGAATRHVVGVLVRRRIDHPLPLGTLLVNVTGSFGLGLVIGLGMSREISQTAGTGFLGAFTTFSSFGYETVRSIEAGSHFHAFLNSAANLTLGLAAAGAGLALGTALR